ncbi:MAG: hypothetical protein HZA02_02920 [Nitrospinae bacterium]|nr:hypothetical protein [Nitrospinota bacterium]
MGDRFDNFQMKVYEALKSAIFEAVKESNNVKNLVKIIKDHHMLEELFEYIDVIETRNLVGSLTQEPPGKQNPVVPSLPASAREDSPEGQNQYIDGRKLTFNEALFHEYCQGRFDELEWLKRNRIRI